MSAATGKRWWLSTWIKVILIALMAATALPLISPGLAQAAEPTSQSEWEDLPPLEDEIIAVQPGGTEPEPVIAPPGDRPEPADSAPIVVDESELLRADVALGLPSEFSGEGDELMSDSPDIDVTVGKSFAPPPEQAAEAAHDEAEADETEDEGGSAQAARENYSSVPNPDAEDPSDEGNRGRRNDRAEANANDEDNRGRNGNADGNANDAGERGGGAAVRGGLDYAALAIAEPIASMSLPDGSVIDVLIPERRGARAARVFDRAPSREAPGRAQARKVVGARLDNVLDDVSVLVEPFSAGVKLTYQVDSKRALKAFDFEGLRLPEGWSARQNGDHIDLLNADGDLQMVWAGGKVWDSAEPRSESAATLRLVGFDQGVAVARVTLDQAWATSRDRVFPVFVDPVVSMAAFAPPKTQHPEVAIVNQSVQLLAEFVDYPAVAYEWRFGKYPDQNCNNASFQASNTTNAVTVPASFLATEGAYLWCVRAKPDANTWTAWSSTFVAVGDPKVWAQMGSNPLFEVFDGVNVATANWSMSRTDVSLESVAEGLAVNRVYNSRSQHFGSFGFGWTFAFDIALHDLGNQVVVTDPDGAHRVFTKNGSIYTRSGSEVQIRRNGNDWWLESPDDTRIEFHSNGRIKAIVDAYGNRLTTQWSYLNGYGDQLTRIIDSATGRSIDIEWTYHVATNGHARQTIYRVKIPHATDKSKTLAWDYRYTNNGYLYRVCDGRPEVDNVRHCEDYTWNTAAEAIERVYDRAGQLVTKVSYRDTGKVSAIARYPLGTAETTRFGPPASLTGTSTVGVSDAKNNPWNFTFDADLKLKAKDAPGEGSGGINAASTGVTSYAYDGVGRRTLVSTGFGYTGKRHTRFAYNPDGTILWEQNGAGEKTWYRYDADNNRDRICPARSGGNLDSKHCTRMTFGPGGRMKTRVTHFETDERATERWEYNSRGQLARHTDAMGRTTTYSYYESSVAYSNGNLMGRRGDLRWITHPSGLQEQFRYNNHGVLQFRYERVSSSSPLILMTSRTFGKIGELTVDRGPTITNAVTGEKSRFISGIYYDANMRVYAKANYDAYAEDTSWPKRRRYYFAYDRLGRETESWGPEMTNIAGTKVFPKITRRFDKTGNVDRVCDARGNCTFTNYNARNLPYRVVAGGIETNFTWYFDDNRVAQTRDAEKRLTYYLYDRAGRPIHRAIKRADGAWENEESLSYWPGTTNPNRRRTGGNFNLSTRAVTGHFTDTRLYFTLNGFENKRVEIQDGSSYHTTESTYFLDGQPKTTKITQGSDTTTTSYTYNNAGHLRTTTADVGGLNLTTTVETDARGHVDRTIDAMGRMTNVDADELGQVIRISRPTVDVYKDAGVTPASQRPTVTMGYDAFGNQTHVRDERGALTVTEYDFFDRVEVINHPVSKPYWSATSRSPRERFAYDNNGNVQRSWDRYGMPTTFQYDAFNQVVRVVGIAAKAGEPTPVTTTEYDKVGNPTRITDPAGAATTYTYNHRNQVVNTTEHVRRLFYSDGFHMGSFTRTWTNGYDESGNRKSSRTPLGYTTRFEYDQLNRLEAEIDPDGQRTEVVYDMLGLVEVTKFPGGFSTINNYDDAGRLRTVTNKGPNGATITSTAMTYDANGNLLTEKTAANKLTTYVYDALNRVKQVKKPSGTDHFGYDAGGELAYWRNGLNRTTRYRINPWGLREETIEPSTSTSPSIAERRFRTEYDVAGQVLRTTEPGAWVSRSYDRRGQLRKETGNDGYWREFDYDLAGRVTNVRATHAPEKTFLFDDQGNLRESIDAGNAAKRDRTVYNYDKDGRVATRHERDLHSEPHRFTWTNQNELWTHDDPVSGIKTTFSWNDAGQITRAKAGTMERRFEYHATGQMMRDSIYEGSTKRGQEYFLYDADANVRYISQYQYGQKWRKLRYTYDSSNRLKTFWIEQTNNGVWPGSAGSQTKTTYTYDAAGNRKTKKTNNVTETWNYDARNRLVSGPEGSYSWDDRGTLKSITKSGKTEAYDFNSLGEMIVRRNTGQATINYSYDGLGRLANRDANNDALFTYAGFDMDPSSDGDAEYGRGPTGSLTSLRDPSGDRRVVGLNRHGDVKYLTNTNGRPTETITFDPFGEIIQQWGSDENPNVGYQGDWTDPDSGDVNMGARWYDAASASFRSRDVYSGRLDTPVSLNRYTYANNNPMRYWDPTGYSSCDAYANGNFDPTCSAGSSEPRGTHGGSNSIPVARGVEFDPDTGETHVNAGRLETPTNNRSANSTTTQPAQGGSLADDPQNTAVIPLSGPTGSLHVDQNNTAPIPAQGGSLADNPNNTAVIPASVPTTEVAEAHDVYVAAEAESQARRVYHNNVPAEHSLAESIIDLVLKSTFTVEAIDTVGIGVIAARGIGLAQSLDCDQQDLVRTGHLVLEHCEISAGPVLGLGLSTNVRLNGGQYTPQGVLNWSGSCTAGIGPFSKSWQFWPNDSGRQSNLSLGVSGEQTADRNTPNQLNRLGGEATCGISGTSGLPTLAIPIPFLDHGVSDVVDHEDLRREWGRCHTSGFLGLGDSTCVVSYASGS